MIYWIFFPYFVSHSWGIPMMKITGLSHLFKWENLHNWWLTKYFFAPLYMPQFCPVSLYPIIISATIVAKCPCDIYDRCAGEYVACTFLDEHCLNLITLTFTCVRALFFFPERKFTLRGWTVTLFIKHYSTGQIMTIFFWCMFCMEVYLDLKNYIYSWTES